ncbi:MAG: cohesin domain-containing protein [Candidatus Eisenbacteria bacterium]
MIIDGAQPGCGWLNRIKVIAMVGAAVVFGPYGATAGGPDEFHALLDPTLYDFVLLGDDFYVSFAVDSTAMQFNGYEVRVEFDPTYLDFTGVVEGSLMTEACPTRFRNLAQTDSSVVYTHVVLCAGVSLDGPGVLSEFHFKALTVGETDVRITSDPNETFVDAGIWVNPDHPTYPRQVSFNDSHVIILDPSSDVEPSDPSVTPADGVRLSVWPQPMTDRASLRIDPTGTGWITTEIVTVEGRQIWHDRSWGEPGSPLRLEWNGRTRTGERVGAGTYFVRTRQGNRSAVQRIVTVR